MRLLVAKSVGGDVFYGFISAVAFATILAVVAGLTLSGASAVSHDLYATVIKKGKADSASELKVSRITTLVLGVIAVLLGIAFEKQNIAFMVSLAFAVAVTERITAFLAPPAAAKTSKADRTFVPFTVTSNLRAPDLVSEFSEKCRRSVYDVDGVRPPRV
mgnify:CR=1 FL=1